MHFLPSHYNAWGVLLSVLIGSFASYVALAVARRIRRSGGVASAAWWACGSLSMGTGIWSMHFVGMLSFSLPIELGYDKLLSFVSWGAGVAVSAVALRLSDRSGLTRTHLVQGALAMGAGICAMHYLGMAAIDLSPAIVWNPWLVAASAAIAVSASAAALLIFFWLRKSSPELILVHRAAAAAVMGLAISGMHYTGMAAADFPAGAVCRSAGSLTGDTLAILVTVLPVLMLALTLLVAVIDVRRRLRQSIAGGGALRAANAQLQSTNDELLRRAGIDPLTGMPNRPLFEDRLAAAVQRLESGAGGDGGAPERLAVLFVDLDAFKPINDSFGHAAGDRLLVEVGQRLARCARPTDTAARIGGDEFVILLEQVHDLDGCKRFADRLQLALSDPFEIEGLRMGISASIGIALYPDHGTPAQLVMRADAAMYAAKRAGRAGYAVFEPQMDSSGRDDLSLQGELREAAERGELLLHYQPKVDLSARGGAAGGPGCVEALVRWNHPERGLIGPGVFIPIAERMGLIRSLGDWVIEEACRQMKAWDDRGLALQVAINLSVYQLRQPDLAQRIGRSLERHRLAPSRLLCEITESVAMQESEATRKVIDELARLGVTLSIDDFGTGYSSLSQLRRLPARQLKIDRSFVTDLESSADARAIVDGVIRLAHALGLRVVAEGVETEGQHAILRKLGCDELQGYLFARPMAADAIHGWFDRRAAQASVSVIRPLVAAA